MVHARSSIREILILENLGKRNRQTTPTVVSKIPSLPRINSFRREWDFLVIKEGCTKDEDT